MWEGVQGTAFVENRGLRLAVHRWTEAPVRALALHGFMDHGGSFRFVAEAAAPTIGLAACDMRGFGRSGWVGPGGYYHFYDYYDDVGVVLAELEEPVGLIGHSMGGSIAAGVAALFPERVRWLLLLEGMGPPAPPLEDATARGQQWLRALARRRASPDERRAQRRPFASLEEGADRLLAFNPKLPPDRAQALAASFSEPSDGGFVWRVDPLHRTPAPKPFILAEAEAYWRSIQVPVLSLWGEEGWRPDDLGRRHACLDQFKAGVIPGAGHNLHHDHPEIIAEAVCRLDAGRLELPAGAVTL